MKVGHKVGALELLVGPSSLQCVRIKIQKIFILQFKIVARRWESHFGKRISLGAGRRSQIGVLT